ncbi:MAG TPA: plasmid pRiA4b ORF-3 family protein [Acidimicrobiales bacterium]
MASDSPPIQLKVTLRDVHPLIWRRLLVPGETTLAKLHLVLQVAMGWEDYHLHGFRIGEKRYGPADYEDVMPDEIDESTVTLAEAFGESRKFFYDYDFGDSWEHEIVLEKTTSTEPQRFARCLAGKRACPPEDSGGVWGYASLLEALADESHEEHEEYLEWAGEDFDPEAFSLAVVNVHLKGLG